MNWSNIAFTLPVFKLPNSQHRVVAITRTFICAAFTLRLHDSTVALNECWSNYMLRFDDFATLVNSVPSIKCDFKWLLLMEKHFPALRKEKGRRWQVAGMYVFLQTVDILWRIKPLKWTQWKLTGKKSRKCQPRRMWLRKWMNWARNFREILAIFQGFHLSALLQEFMTQLFKWMKDRCWQLRECFRILHICTFHILCVPNKQ